jgi:hypothetical protein
MSTKPASKIQPTLEGSIESIAYAAAAAVPTREPNDRARLGYCLWTWLTERKGTLDGVIKAAGVRTDLTAAEVMDILRRQLEAKGIPVS